MYKHEIITETLTVINYTFQIIYIIKINIDKFIIIAFNEANNLIISNKSINKFLNKFPITFNIGNNPQIKNILIHSISIF